MSALQKERSPRQAKPRAENRKAFDVRQQYTELQPFVKPQICWACGYYREARRKFCAFLGENVKPSDACRVDPRVWGVS